MVKAIGEDSNGNGKAHERSFILILTPFLSLAL
jgi:hypothetical protein